MNLYLSKSFNNNILIDTITNDTYINKAVNNYIIKTYKVEPIFTDKTIKEIRIDAQLKDGIYVDKNMKLYKKETIKSEGVIYNSYAYDIKKIGKFIIIKNTNIYEKKIDNDIPNAKQVKKIITELNDIPTIVQAKEIVTELNKFDIKIWNDNNLDKEIDKLKEKFIENIKKGVTKINLYEHTCRTIEEQYRANMLLKRLQEIFEAKGYKNIISSNYNVQNANNYKWLDIIIN